MTAHPARRPTSALLAAATLCASASGAGAVEFRLQAQAGFAFTSVDSDTLSSFDDASRPARLTNLDSGSGLAYGVSAWADGLLHPNLSIGVEYLHTKIDPDAKLRVSSAAGTRSLALPAEATTDMAFANVAWRSAEGRLKPYFGVGGGGGYARLDIDSRHFSGGFEQVVGGAQAFVGLDYELGPRTYVGASFRAFYLPAGAGGYDASMLQFVGLAGLGLRF